MLSLNELSRFLKRACRTVLNRNLLAVIAATASLAAFGDSVQVSTVDDLLAELAGSVNEIVLMKSGSPYALTAKITVSREVTIRGETGNPADVVINGSGVSGLLTCTALVLGNAGAVIEGITFKNCKAENAGGGVRVTSGTIRNCVFDSGYHGGNSGCSGCGVYINGGSAVVTDCVIKNCHVGMTGGGNGIGAYITGAGRSRIRSSRVATAIAILRPSTRPALSIWTREPSRTAQS